ncbi:MAG: pyridoxamine 5'-phosphate oxidase family protein [Ktedonobacteraceae bacterium]
MQEDRNILVDVHTSIPAGQQYARTRWNTQESGAAFDRKKTTYLTEEAQRFIAQQSFYVIAGLGPHNRLDGRIVMGEPGCVKTPDEHTCILRLARTMEHAGLLQGFQQSFRNGHTTRPGLFFISHTTRERLCVQGSLEMLIADSPNINDSLMDYANIRVLMHVERAFFHCSKYIRTRVAGLTVPGAISPAYKQQLVALLSKRQDVLTEEMCEFIRQQVLSFLCTVDADGQCAVNHRGGAPGFLVALPPDAFSPGGTILLPDYTGNGAFEATGNILETGLATLIIPDYVAQLAVRISGSACILEMSELSSAIKQRCVGAERVLAISVQRVELQTGNWSSALTCENARSEAALTHEGCSV